MNAKPITAEPNTTNRPLDGKMNVTKHAMKKKTIASLKRWRIRPTTSRLHSGIS
jgi:hypothetical protein